MAQAKYKWMDAQFDSKCGECFDPIEAGDRIAYDIAQQTALCRGCGEERFGEELSLDEAERMAEGG